MDTVKRLWKMESGWYGEYKTGNVTASGPTIYGPDVELDAVIADIRKRQPGVWFEAFPGITFRLKHAGGIDVRRVIRAHRDAGYWECSTFDTLPLEGQDCYYGPGKGIQVMSSEAIEDLINV